MDRIRSSSGIHRDSEMRGSSHDFLNKFSAMVRRASHWQKEDPHDNSNQHFHDHEHLQGSIDFKEEKSSTGTRGAGGATCPLIFRHSSTANSKMLRHTSRSKTAPLTIGSLKAGTASIIRRFRAPMALTKEELERRRQVETWSFQVLHEVFMPVNMVQEDIIDNNSAQDEEEKEMHRDSEEKWPVLQRRQSNDEDHGEIEPQQDEEEEEEQASQQTDCHEELHFDEANITNSVRKLVQRIETESVCPLIIGSMNQNDNEDVTADVDPHDVSGLMEQIRHQKSHSLLLHKVSNTTTISAEDEGCADGIEGQQVEDDQDDTCLTSSMRRLVLRLKDDSDQIHYFKDHKRQDLILHLPRRRGTSCPPPRINSNFTSQEDQLTQPSLSELYRWTTSFSSRKNDLLNRLTSRPRALWKKVFVASTKRKRMYSKKTYLFTDEELENIEGARWKIIELAFRFGGRHRFYLEQAVNMFFPLRKYGRRGDPHPTRLHCNRCGTIQWQHKKGNLSEPMDLADILQVLDGRQTLVFHKYQTNESAEARSLSLVFSTRTLDLETQNGNHRDWLISALRTLISYARKQRLAETKALEEANGTSGFENEKIIQAADEEDICCKGNVDACIDGDEIKAQVVTSPKSPLTRQKDDTRGHAPVTTA